MLAEIICCFVKSINDTLVIRALSFKPFDRAIFNFTSSDFFLANALASLAFAFSSFSFLS